MIPASVVLPTLSDGTPITKSSEFGFEKFPTAKELPNLSFVSAPFHPVGRNSAVSWFISLIVGGSGFGAGSLLPP